MTDNERLIDFNRQHARAMADAKIQACAFGMMFVKRERVCAKLWRKFVTKEPAPLDVAATKYGDAWEEYRRVCRAYEILPERLESAPMR